MKSKVNWKIYKGHNLEGLYLNNQEGVTIALITKRKDKWVVTLAVPELLKSKAAAKREALSILNFLGLMQNGTQ